MRFVEKIQNSWSLMKTSLGIMWQNKKLMLFPFLTTILMLFVLLFFFTPILLQDTGNGYLQVEHWRSLGDRLFSHTPGGVDSDSTTTLSQEGWIYLSVLYFVSMFAATFFNVAFYHEILRALAGESVSIRRGFGFACKKVSSIFLWSLLAGVVGYVIRLLEERVGFVGKIVLALIGTAWSVASVFAVPTIIVQEDTNPFTVLRSSASLLKRTWGESLIGFMGVQFGSLLIILGSIGYFAVLGMLVSSLPSSASNWMAVLVVVTLPIWALSVFALIYLLGVANHIYRCALFTFASQGQPPASFTRAEMDIGWKMKA